MMSMFLILFAGTLASLLYAFAFDADRTLQDSSVVALFWSWYNCAVLLITALVCIERPRIRRDDRLRTRDKVTLTSHGISRDYNMIDISISGLRLAGNPIADQGSVIHLKLGDHEISGTIVRKTEFDFAVRPAENPDDCARMIQHVYSGTYLSGVRNIRSTLVAKQVLARILQ